VPVEVVLVLAAELKEVVPLKQRKVVSEEMVLPIPEAGTNILGVYVEW
jgi:hypothetical protein